jgi:hypothetical protein
MGQEISSMISGTTSKYQDVGATEETKSKQLFRDSITYLNEKLQA